MKVVAFAVVSIALRERLVMRKDLVLVPVVVALRRQLAVGLVAAEIAKVEEYSLVGQVEVNQRRKMKNSWV